MNARKIVALLFALGLVSVVAACGDTKMDYAGDSDRMHVSDYWVKAAPEGMSAAFMKIHNDSPDQIRIVAASSDVAGTTELHEMREENGAKTMAEKADGYVVEAHKTLDLTPGGDHIMLMELKRPIAAGDMVPITLTFADGSQATIEAAARDFAGNQEEYGHVGDETGGDDAEDHSHH